MVEYLRGNATASATGLFVICRHLSAFAGGRSEGELRNALQVLRRSRNSGSESSSVLTASLEVGEGLGIIKRANSSAPWTVDADLIPGLQSDGDQWPWFRGELLRRMTLHGIYELQNTGKVPDLVLGLTWFLQRNPLQPLPWAWGAGPEELIKGLNFGAISNVYQWRPFRRWALALGLAQRSEQNVVKVLFPDASTAIADQLPHLPRVASAAEWMNELRARLPVLGAQSLLEQLPRGGPPWDGLPQGVALGLLKLQKAGVLSLMPSDDASDVVVLGIGDSARQVGRIAIRSK